MCMHEHVNLSYGDVIHYGDVKRLSDPSIHLISTLHSTPLYCTQQYSTVL